MSPEQIAALALASVAVFWMLGAYNRLVALRNAVGEAWIKVEEAQRQRGDALAPLVAAVREPLAAEPGLFDALLAAQGASEQATVAMAAHTLSARTAANWVAAESTLAAAASRVLALLEQHAGLRTQEPVAGLVQACRALEPRMAFTRQLFNETAVAYDQALAQFPTRLLVRWFRFRPAGRI